MATTNHNNAEICHLGLCLHTCSRCSTDFDHVCRVCEPDDAEALVCADVIAFDGSINCSDCLEVVLERQQLEHELSEAQHDLSEAQHEATAQYQKLIDQYFDLDPDEYNAVAEIIGEALAWDIRRRASVQCGAAGLIIWKQGDRETALNFYSRAIDLDPDNSVLILNRGNLRCELGYFEAGIEDLERAHDMDPNLPWENATLFKLLGTEGREAWRMRLLAQTATEGD